jgi:hypothetical protein
VQQQHALIAACRLPSCGGGGSLPGNHHPLNQRLIEAYVLQKGDAAPNTSGRQEFLKNLINEFV